MTTITTVEAQTGSGKGAPEAPEVPTVIGAIHAQYEAAWSAYNAADRYKAEQGTTDAISRARGLQDSDEEQGLLQLALLYQVPTSDRDLSILAYHAWCLQDAESLRKREKRAVQHALGSILDYLVSESRIDMQGAGEMFHTGAMLAFERRRFRTGQMED